MRLRIRLRLWLEDQRGLSLIEILGAVTIMSIISVTLMGYFIAGMNNSEEQSRRVIAINLARLKAAEIRNTVKPKAVYDFFVSSMSPGIVNTYDVKLPDMDNFGHTISLKSQNVNGTTYCYKVSFDRNTIAGTRNEELAYLERYLIPMSITVYWGKDSEANILAAKSTAIDTYIVTQEVINVVS